MTFRLPILGLNDSNFPLDGQGLTYNAAQNQFEWRDIYNAMTVGLVLPGLTGYWVASKVDATLDLYDISGPWAVSRTLSNVSVPQVGYDGLIPYVLLDGTNDYFRQADAAWQDILGTEGQVLPVYRGLTLAGWFYSDTSAANARLMSKWGAVGTNRSYSLYKGAADTILFGVEDPVDVAQFVATTTTITADTWFFAAGRFDPGNEIKAWLYADSVVNVTSIVASIRNSTSGFTIGARDDGAEKLDGRFSQGFLCTMALSDDLIDKYFQQTRVLYGV